MLQVLQSASTLASRHVACALAGLERVFTPFFFLLGVGTFFVLSRPGYFKEALAIGVFRGACGWSLLFFERFLRAFSTFGTARAAMFTAGVNISIHHAMLRASGNLVGRVRNLGTAHMAYL